MEVYFVIGESSAKPGKIYERFLRDKTVCVLADENPFWNMDLSNFSGKIIAYWPERDPVFKHITNRVKKIQRTYKRASLELLDEFLKRYNKIYLPIEDWGTAYLHIFYLVSEKLKDEKVRVVLIDKVGLGGLTEFAALRYISLKKETIVYTSREGLEWIRDLMKLTGAQAVPFRIVLLENLLKF